MIVENPIIWADFPDPDILRIGDTYYMVSTTMFMMPGGPILRSKDLCNWELVSYIFDKLEDNEIYRLENGKNAYGNGQWATSLRYYDRLYYACFASNDLKKTYIYYTDDIEKSYWDRYIIEGVYHDASLLFDGGRAYLIYGNGDIGIVELNEDLSGLKEGGLDQVLLKTPSQNMLLRCEGCRAYRLKGYYYLLFIDWPRDGSQRRRVVCYRSKQLLGDYERRLVLDDDMGYKNQGVAQGAIIDSPDGIWYSILFQDRGAVGRIPYLMPVSWEEGWPVLGYKGRVPEAFETPFKPCQAEPLIISDSFDHKEDRLGLQWQWNHNLLDGCWSFTDRPGYLRLRTNALADDILSARNTLTQRTSGPKCAFTIELDTEGLRPGDYAGLVAFQSKYGTIGVKADRDNTKRILVCKRNEEGKQVEEAIAPLNGPCIFLKVGFDFRDGIDLVSFYYSYDGTSFSKIGKDLKMKYTLDLFIGYRIGVFNYAVEQAGGYADFRSFTYSLK
ncbi:MAG TPA: glycoside hydrolase 43 family protein [Bacillota bacterium]|nr:glycoside hydrolase 43 family protein [Bacillota bacterium]